MTGRSRTEGRKRGRTPVRARVAAAGLALALALSGPAVAPPARAVEGGSLDELRRESAALAGTAWGAQADALFARIDQGVSADEQALIEAQIRQLIALAGQEGTPSGGDGAAAGSDAVAGEGPAQEPVAGAEGGEAVPDSPTAEPAPGNDPAPGGDEGSGDGPSSGEGEEGGEGSEGGSPGTDPAPDGPNAGEDPGEDSPEEGADPSPDSGEDEEGAPEAGPGEGAAPGQQPNAGQEPAPNPPTALPLVPEAGSFSSGEVPHYDYTEDLTTEKFVAVVGEQARAIAQENGLYASVMIAQAILESGSGQSALSKAPHNNLFGIKGAWEDEDGEKHSVSFLTSEDDGAGALYQIVSGFRAYDTIADSLQDYADLLTEDMGEFYQGAWKKNAKTYEEAAKWLQGRYATDTSYAAKLCGLIETYRLDRFDEALPWTPVDEDVDLTDLLAEATSHLGTAYVWGGASPLTGFDCSGLVQWSYEEALGIEISRTTYTQCLEGELVPFDDLHPGDLLFFEDGGDVHHVALYLGDGFYLHAPQQGEPVKVTSMEEYEPDFARRIVPTRPVEEAPVVSKVLQGMRKVLALS